MEEKHNELLKSIGLTEGEIKVYNYLIKKDNQKVSQISKETSLNRSNLYKILDKLVEKKLIFPSMVEGTKIFCITRKERIKEIYKEKIKELKEKDSEINNYLKDISQIGSLDHQSSSVFGIELYEGEKEVKKIFESTLKNMKKGEIIYSFGYEGIFEKKESYKYWLRSQINKRISRKVKYKAVFNTHKGASSSKSDLTEIRYANLGDIDGNVEIAFYKNIIIIYMIKDNERALLIKNNLLYSSLFSYFRFLWEKSNIM